MHKLAQADADELHIFGRGIFQHNLQIKGGTGRYDLKVVFEAVFGRLAIAVDGYTIADLQRFPELLAQRGYSPADIEGIMYRNWVDFFVRAWSR